MGDHVEICVLIMAGGHGTRFWPWSSESLPKQFLPLAHPDKSLLRQTVERVAPLCGIERVMVLTNGEYVDLVKSQIPDLPADNVLAEPMLKDTAAAVGLGSFVASKRWPGAMQAVLPADHEIAPDERFRDILRYTAQCAEEDGLLYTIGIKPSRPTSAYGYLRRGLALDAPRGFKRSDVEAFVEKPDRARARSYVESGEYYWNAGMFIWRGDAVREAFERQLPGHAKSLGEAASAYGTADFDETLRLAFSRLEKISVDYGIMQAEGEAGRVRCVEGDFRWSDLGGWEAFAEKLETDAHNNKVYGHSRDWEDETWEELWQPRRPVSDDDPVHIGEVFTMDANGNLVFNNQPGHRVAILGVDDLAVIHTPDATLITTRSKAEAIKPLVSKLPKDE